VGQHVYTQKVVSVGYHYNNPIERVGLGQSRYH